jgi:hypothetical protein
MAVRRAPNHDADPDDWVKDLCGDHFVPGPPGSFFSGATWSVEAARVRNCVFAVTFAGWAALTFVVVFQPTRAAPPPPPITAANALGPFVATTSTAVDSAGSVLLMDKNAARSLWMVATSLFFCVIVPLSLPPLAVHFGIKRTYLQRCAGIMALLATLIVQWVAVWRHLQFAREFADEAAKAKANGG